MTVNAMNHMCREQWIRFEWPSEAIPGHSRLTGSTVQPIALAPLHLQAEAAQGAAIAGDSIIGVVALPFAAQGTMLSPQRPMAIGLAPVVFGRFTLNNGAPLMQEPSVTGETQLVKALAFPAAL